VSHLWTGTTVLHIAMTVRNRTTSGDPLEMAFNSCVSVQQEWEQLEAKIQEYPHQKSIFDARKHA
jgi:hypothetical protein